MADPPRAKLKFDTSCDRDSPLPSRYQIRGELGRGGMGIVYHAFDRETSSQVAVKVISEGGSNQALAERLRREARELSHLSHPNVVGYLGQGIRGARQYIVLEYVAGGDLRRLLKTRPPLGTVLRLFHGVALGLDYLHQEGLVHRDLKPENILIAADGTARLTDLGLVKALESTTHLTTEGAIVGTYSYLAPEQIVSGQLTPACDLYALGACLYEACTGQPMFVANTDFEMLEQHLRSDPIPPRQHQGDLPEELEGLILALVCKKAEGRPLASEVARRLGDLLGRHSVEEVLAAPVAFSEPEPEGWIPEWRRALARRLKAPEPVRRVDPLAVEWEAGQSGFPAPLLVGNLRELGRGLEALEGTPDLKLPAPSDRLRVALDRALAGEARPDQREELENLGHELQVWCRQRDEILGQARRAAQDLVELRRALSARGQSLKAQIEASLEALGQRPCDEPGSARVAGAWIARLDEAWAGMMRQVGS